MESLNLPSILTPDFGLLFWTLLAFLVLFFILGKFAFPAINKMVEERKSFIEDSLKNARAANEKLANIEAQSEKVLSETREKQAQILKEAAATRDAIIKEAKTKAEVESNKILEEAKMQIQLEKANALQDIRSQVAELSIEIAAKVLAKHLNSEATHSTYIEELLNKVENKTL